MELKSVHQAWYSSLVDQIRSISEEKKQPRLRVTSKPVAVKDIWGLYDFKRKGVSVSAAAHVLVVAVAFGMSAYEPPGILVTDSIDLVIPVDISPYLAQLMIQNQSPDQSGGGGGGGQNSPLPPSRGRLPRFSMEQLTPPTPVIRNPDPELPVEPTVLVPPSVEVPQLDLGNYGDPLAGIGPPSAGPGTGGGIGSGVGTGVGPGRGGGVGQGSGGGIGGGVFRVGGGVSPPRLTYKVEPEYSEQARKAKYQGTVVLAVEVWPDGAAHNVRVLRSLGLGLDEKAIEAVEKWKFVPGRKDGKPVKVAATIEVNFRLL
jgi:TonB family protein